MPDVLKQFAEFYTRPEMDRTAPWLAQRSDWALILGFVILIHSTLKYYAQSSDKPRFRRNLYILLLIHVFMRYGLHAPYYTVLRLIPLSSCGLAAVLLPVLYMADKRWKWLSGLSCWVVFAGTYGGLLALFLAAPSGYNGLHILNLDYHLGHFLIAVIGMIEIMDRPQLYGKDVLRQTSYIAAGYLLVCTIMNHFIGSNYGFMNAAPTNVSFLSALPSPVYRLMVLAGYLLANFLTWHTANFFIHKDREAAEIPLQKA